MSPIEKMLEEKSKKINQEIEKVVPHNLNEKSVEALLGKPRYAYDIETLNGSLSKPIWDLLDRGGKRWRPALMMMAYEAVSGKKGEEILKYTPIVEMIHNGTLMVDDVEDDSALRRGAPCVHKIYGVDIAVNAGNAMYYFPLALLINNTELDAEKKAKLYDIATQEMINLSAGQGMDIYWHRGQKSEISEQQYLQMCAYKTGTLARMAGKLGAVL
ncbi:MAG: polyprenyl synthetase family protein, partial [Candidatus Diapherotrites archaeon]